MSLGLRCISDGLECSSRCSRDRRPDSRREGPLAVKHLLNEICCSPLFALFCMLPDPSLVPSEAKEQQPTRDGGSQWARRPSEAELVLGGLLTAFSSIPPPAVTAPSACSEETMQVGNSYRPSFDRNSRSDSRCWGSTYLPRVSNLVPRSGRSSRATDLSLRFPPGHLPPLHPQLTVSQ
ncbi:hypothetical protein BJX76DRAFT_330166 [Aspergillus varians]